MAIAPEDALGLDEAAEALDNGWTLPARWYSDPDVAELEHQKIFASSWTLLCPEAKLASTGDHVVGQSGRVPVVVTRDAEGKLHGFVNVCRHRAHPVAMKDGCRKLLQCRYHGWTYTLDGRLENAPRMSREMDFEREDYSLVPVAVDTWRGFVFVNPDAAAAPLHDVHPALEPLAIERNLGFADWKFRSHWVYPIEANWKVFVENATECYHCPTVHTKSFSDAFITDANVYELVETGGLLCQFTPYNARRANTRWGGQTGDGFRFIYIWPTSFWAQDDQVAFTGHDRAHRRRVVRVPRRRVLASAGRRDVRRGLDGDVRQDVRGGRRRGARPAGRPEVADDPVRPAAAEEREPDPAFPPARVRRARERHPRGGLTASSFDRP